MESIEIDIFFITVFLSILYHSRYPTLHVPIFEVELLKNYSTKCTSEYIF